MTYQQWYYDNYGNKAISTNEINQEYIVKFVNLTNRAVNVLDQDGELVVFPPSGIVCRVVSEENHVKTLNGITCVAQHFGEVKNLPDPAEDTVYIVSGTIMYLAQRLFPDRTDLVSPNTSSGVVRNDRGHILHVSSFKCLGA